jgi:hypothetical protein
VITTDVGDDAATIAARERLGPMLAGTDDPYLYALGQLTIAGISAIVGDFDGALRAASVSVERFRAQDEPFWTAVAARGRLRPALGRYDEARQPDRGAWRGAAVRQRMAGRVSGAALANVAVIQSRSTTRPDLLEDALDLSLAAYSNRSVTPPRPRTLGCPTRKAMPNWPRCWRERLTACAFGLGCVRGRPCGMERRSW